MTVGADDALVDRQQFVLLRSRSECQNKDSAIGAKLGMLDAANMVSQDEVS